MASGSEVSLIVSASERLHAQGVAVRCVSMPSWKLFDARPQADRDSVLPPSVKARLAVEAGAAQGWHRYVGDTGDVLSVDRFGASAPGNEILQHYGFTVDNVCARSQMLLAEHRETSASLVNSIRGALIRQIAP
jgi:transketolase